MLLRVPDWLDDHDFGDSLGEPLDGADRAVSDDLIDAIVYVGNGSAGASNVSWIVIDGVRVLVAVLAPVVGGSGIKALAHIAQHLACVERRAGMAAHRAAVMNDNASGVARYVDRLVNMPRSAKTRDLVRWLSVRSAEWRCKISMYTTDLGEDRAAHERLGRPAEAVPNADDVDAVIAALRSTTPFARAQRDFDRAGGLLDSASSALASAHELLDAMLGSYRDEQGDKMQRSGYILSIAVTVTGLNALGALLFNGSGVWDLDTSVVATVLPAVIPLGVLGFYFGHDKWASRKTPAQGTTQDLEGRINALVEGYANPIHTVLHAVEPPLRERVHEPVQREEWLARIARIEADAAGLLCSVISVLRDRWRELDASDVAALDLSQKTGVRGLRELGLARLDQLARTQEITSALFGDFDVAEAPFPDLAVTLWLFTPVLGFAPDPLDFVTENLRGVVIDGLERSPREVAEMLDHVADVLSNLLGVPEGQDVWEFFANEHEPVRRALLTAEPRDVVAKFTRLRLSHLLSGPSAPPSEVASFDASLRIAQ